MLISNVFSLSRDLLNDSRPPVRWSDAFLVGFLNQALLETKRLRSDLFISSAGVVIEYTDADAALTFPIDDTYLMPIVEFVVGMVELSDDEYATDGKAVAMLTVFARALSGVGNGS